MRVGAVHRRHVPAVLLCMGVLAIFALHVRLYDTFADDAYITFRYARNLARGVGPVWNAGERVEGYSNALWMFLLAGVYGIARDALPYVARLLSCAFAAGAVVIGFALARRLTRSVFWAAVAGAGIAASSAFAAHARNGLESSAFAFFIVLVAWALTSTSVRWLAFALFAVSACRFEGALVAAVAGVAVAAGGIRTPVAFRFLRASFAWVPAYVLLNVWRLAYYRHLLPNSVVAKQGRSADARFTQGMLYVRGFFDADNVVFALFLLGALGVLLHLARRRVRPFEPALTFVLAVSVVYTAFVVWIGGCWMPAWRMMAHVVPAIVVFGAVSFGRLSTATTHLPGARIVGRVAFVLSFAFGVQHQLRSVSPTHENLVPRITYWRDQVLALAEMGQWLDRTLPRDARVATFAAGALPYYAHVPCLDVLGLNDEHIARSGKKDPNGVAGHISTDWPYVVSQRPAVYVATGGGGFAPTKSMRSEPMFKPGYDAALFEFTETKNPQGRFLTLMLTRDRKAALLTALQSDPRVVLVRAE